MDRAHGCSAPRHAAVRRAAHRAARRRVAAHGSWLVGGGLVAGGCNAIFGIDQLSFDGATGATTATQVGGAGAGAWGGGEGATTGPGGEGQGGGSGVGAPCLSGAECGSGFCTDGHCCESACTGPCEACASAGSEGRCVPHEAGTDPEAGCGEDLCDGAATCATGAVRWALRFGDWADQTSFVGRVDPFGDLLIVGGATGSFALGGEVLAGSGDADVFIAKLAPDGSHLWSRRFGDAASQYGDFAASVAADGTGMVLVTGYFDGNIGFGVPSLTAAGMLDVFLAAFAPDGTHLWSHAYGDGNDQWGMRTAADPTGNLLVAGWFTGTLDLGPGALSSSGGRDVFVAKLTSAGHPLWTRRFGDGSDQELYGLTTDALGNVIVSGRYSGTIDFGSGPLPNGAGTEGFVAKLSPNGEEIWSKGATGDGEQVLRNPVADEEGNVVLTGYFESSIGLDGSAHPSLGEQDGLVAKLDAAGNVLWIRTFGDGALQQGRDVALDAAGNVIVTGPFEGTVDFGRGPLVSMGDSDAFAAKWSSDGTPIWSRQLGGLDTQVGTSVAAGPDRGLFVIGSFRGTIDADDVPLTSAGQSDVFVVALEP